MIRIDGYLSALIVAAIMGSAVLFWQKPIDDFTLVKVTFVWIITLGVVVLTLSDWFRRGIVRVPRSPFIALLGAFVAAMVIAVAVSPSTTLSLIGQYRRYTGFFPYLSYVILAFTAVALATRSSMTVDRVVRAIWIAASLVALYALIQAAGADPLEWVSATSAAFHFSTAGNINFASAYIGLGVPAALYEVMSRRSPAWLRAAAGIALLLAVGGIAATLSIQGRLVALIGALVVLGVGAWERWRVGIGKAGRRIALGGLGLAIIVLFAGIANKWSAIVSRLGTGYRQRLEIYQVALDAMSAEPVFGIGLDAFGRMFTRLQDGRFTTLYGYNLADTAHSVPLGMFVGGGFLLGLVYLVLVGYVALMLFRGIRHSTGDDRMRFATLTGIWLGYHIQAAISMDEPQLAVVHWVVSGLVVGLVERPPQWEVALSGGRGSSGGRKRSRKRVRSRPADIALVGPWVLLVAAIATLWPLTRPLRADVAAGRADALGKLAASEPRAIPLAFGAFNSASELAPWEGSYWNLRAEFAESIGETAVAFEASAQAAELNPGQPLYALNAGQLARQLGDLEAASYWFEYAVQHDPNDARTLAAAASHFAQVGTMDRAQELARAALEIDPGEVTAREILAAVRS